MVERKLMVRDRIIGVLLRDARRRARRSKAECADALGVSQERIEAYEEGRKSISLPELEVLGHFLNVPLYRFWEAEPRLEAADQTRPDYRTVLDLRHRIVGALLRQVRLEAELSREDLAEILACPIARVSEYERGEEPIAVSELELLAEQLDIPVDSFVDGHRGTVGGWHRQQEIDRSFHELRDSVQAFVAESGNAGYVDVAMELSRLPVDELRSVAKALLDIPHGSRDMEV